MNKYFSHRSQVSQIMSGVLVFATFIGITPATFLTIANAAEPTARLSVVTVVENNDGGTHVPGDFIINVTAAGANPPYFVGSSIAREVEVTAGANFTVAATTGVHYTATYSPTCTGNISVVRTSTCTVTMRDIAAFAHGTISPNLIPNGDLESIDSTDATRPTNWSAGWMWGTNIASYVYPVTGMDSPLSNGKVMSISYPTYTGNVLVGGDAKWYTAPVPVVSGHRYLYEDSYSANTPTYIVAEFFTATNQRHSTAGFHLISSTATGTWKKASAAFVVPDGATSMTVYHQLNSVGTLYLDNVSIKEIALPKMFNRGIVSLAFDDGYNSHYENARAILNAKGTKGTFYAVTHNSGLGILNAGLETPDGTNASIPMGWFSSGGVGSVYAYPVSGRTGVAVRFSSTNPASGSGWNFQPVNVFANQSHQFSHYYKSTATSGVYIKVKKTDGTTAYMQNDGGLVSGMVAYKILPASSQWTFYTTPGMWIPPDSQTISLRYGLMASGTLEIDDVNMGAYLDFMTPDQLRELQSDGHEIGGHTETHANLTLLPFAHALQEMRGSREDLLTGGFIPVESFAYPLGENNNEIQEALAGAGFTTGRGTIPGFNGKDDNRYALRSKMVMTDTSLAEVQQLINDAVAGRSWLILTFHHVLPSGATGTTAFNTTPERLESIISYLTKNNISVLTVGEAAKLMDGGGVVPPAPPVVVVPPPTPTPAPAPTTGGGGGSSSGGGGSASSVYYGCVASNAQNYNRLANRDDGSCIFVGASSNSTSTLTTSTTSSSTVIATTSTSNLNGGTVTTNLGEVLGASTSTPRHVFKSYLRLGSRGKDVIELQKHLTASGYFKGPVTGYYGIKTFAAVKKFQAIHKLDSIGLVGPKTRALLNKNISSWTVSSTDKGINIVRI